MREEVKSRLDNIVGAMVIPQSTEDKLVQLIKDLEAEIEASQHNIHYLEKQLKKFEEAA